MVDDEQEPPLEEKGAGAAQPEPGAAQGPFAWALAGAGPTTLGAFRRAQRQALEATIATPVAQPAPLPRPLISRRFLILGGFWTGLALALIGILGWPLDFVYPRRVKGFGGPITVPRERIPPPGGEPVRIVEGKFWLLNLRPGVTPNGEETPGGLLALWQKCPHLGCTVPWRPDFVFANRKGWFRCPCHGSTYTKEGGIRVFGPAPRSMDRFPIEIQDNGNIVVQTGVAKAEKGSPDNPAHSVPYNV